ncbi:histidine phosphatase family protein [Alteribacter natronophilus]|uniref:histidine phosphatase family protein n=1 Tax=Alteribacter natronophilus TaxID=2583810 RepID=UPI00110DD806|nr:histidine phosphatase family protein [Alteribacter natronophilus]TMW70995.1 histidine phosphatase family protein [Alteribacter natronophilus]
MIYVVRHGETDLNKEGRMQGRQGLPLNDTGLRQAEDLRRQLNGMTFDCVYSSPQARAVRTAEIVSGKQADTAADLDVFDLGEADRLKTGEVRMNGIVPDASVYPGLEDVNQFVKRIFRFMTGLEKRYRGTEKNVLIAGHRCTTGCIGAYFEGLPEDGNILRFSSDTGKYKVYQFHD